MNDYKHNKVKSKQQAQNQKRIKEIERTFNISLTNNAVEKPPRQPPTVSKDPFENDQKPLECLSQRLNQLQAKQPDNRRGNEHAQRSVAVKAGQLQVFMGKVDSRAESTNQHLDYSSHKQQEALPGDF